MVQVNSLKKASRSALIVAVCVVVVALVVALGIALPYISGQLPLPWKCSQISESTVLGPTTTEASSFIIYASNEGLSIDGEVVDPSASCYVTALVYTPATNSRRVGGTMEVDADGRFYLSVGRLIHPELLPADVVIEVALGGPYCANLLQSLPSDFMGEVPDICTVRTVNGVRVSS